MAKETPSEGRKGTRKGEGQPLQTTFREFSLEEPKPAPRQPEPAKPEQPSDFDEYFNELARRHAANDNDGNNPANDPEWSLEFEEEQKRIAEAARGLLPDSPEINLAIDEASNLDMLGVVAGGILEEHFRGLQEDDVVDSFIAAALLVDAKNFDDISKKFDGLTAGIVDDILDAEDSDDPEEYVENLKKLEPESKQVFMALQIAELEVMQQEVRAGADAPSKEEQEALGDVIVAASKDVDRGLMRRAVSLFNEVSRESELTATLTMDKDGGVELHEYPNIRANRPPKGPKATPPKPKP